MNSELLTMFAAAVIRTEGLPESVRAAADRAIGVKLGTFGDSYLEFLRQQIDLAPRGPEWTDRLKRRVAGLSGWCDCPLIDGRIVVNRNDYWIKVDPKTEAVVYWEEYNNVVDDCG